MNDPRTDLTERYVHAVLRAIPGRQRADLEPELRSLVGDAIEARDGDERAALAELGDPAALAARYAGGPQYLIGPGTYLEWRRLLGLLVPIVVPIVGAVVGGSSLLGGATPFESIVAAFASAFAVGLQLVFWVTVVFALIERFGTPGVVPRDAWTVDDLPEITDGAVSRFEIGISIAVNVLLIAGLVWAQVQSPIVLDGERFGILDPALWPAWLLWFIGVTVLEIGMLVTILARGRWTWGAAVANAALGAAFAVPAIYLLQTDRLFDPALVARLTEIAGGDWFRPTATIVAIVIVLVVAWDAIDGFLKARRASRVRAGRGLLQPH